MRSKTVRAILQWLSFGITSAIVILFVLPGQLKVHQGTSALTPNMSINVFSHLCKTPEPNINVSEEQLLSFWQLPARAEPSRIMESIGRCRIAVVNKGSGLQPDVCDCVPALWPLFVWSVAYVYLLLSIPMVLTCVEMGLKKKSSSFKFEDDAAKVRRERRFVLIWLAVWAIAMFTFAWQSPAAGMTYKLYGDLFSRAYFRTPQTWCVAWSLTVVMVALQMMHYFACTVALRDAVEAADSKPMQASRKVSPPPAVKREMQFAAWKKPLCKEAGVQTDKVIVISCNDQMGSPGYSLMSLRSLQSDSESSEGEKSEMQAENGLTAFVLFEKDDKPAPQE